MRGNSLGEGADEGNISYTEAPLEAQCRDVASRAPTNGEGKEGAPKIREDSWRGAKREESTGGGGGATWDTWERMKGRDTPGAL